MKCYLGPWSVTFLLFFFTLPVSRPDLVGSFLLPRYLRARGVGRLRGGVGESRHEMNERWRNEARERKRLEREEQACGNRKHVATSGEEGRRKANVTLSPPTFPHAILRHDPAVGVLVESEGGPVLRPRAQILAELCARQQCNALDPALYDFNAIGEDANKYSSLSDYIEWTRHRKTSDEDVGITEYVTTAPGVGGLLKARWADFYVQEIRLRDSSRVSVTDTVSLPPRPWPLRDELDNLDCGFHLLSQIIGHDAASRSAE